METCKEVPKVAIVSIETSMFSRQLGSWFEAGLHKQCPDHHTTCTTTYQYKKHRRDSAIFCWFDGCEIKLPESKTSKAHDSEVGSSLVLFFLGRGCNLSIDEAVSYTHLRAHETEADL
eukprot:4368026-Amphidinium_carterae.1